MSNVFNLIRLKSERERNTNSTKAVISSRAVRLGFIPAILVCASLSCVLADPKYPHLPDQIFVAKTVFIQNNSGEQKFAKNVYREIEEWGRWQLVTNRLDADIVIVLDRRPLNSKDLRNNFYLRVLDRETSQVLYTLMQSVAMDRLGSEGNLLVSDLRKRLGH